MSTATAVKHRIEKQFHHEKDDSKSKTQAAVEFAQQAERLGQYTPEQENETTGSTQAIEAHFVTPQDPVIETADGHRLPAVPLEEATKLNELRNIIEDGHATQQKPLSPRLREAKDGTVHGLLTKEAEMEGEGKFDVPLGDAKAPWKTNPLFPPLPIEAEEAWRKQDKIMLEKRLENGDKQTAREYEPLEGGLDPLVCDARYYARRVGLDCEIFNVQTEDGFIIELWHLYNPRDYKRTNAGQRSPHSPELFPEDRTRVAGSQYEPGEKKYPVLMIHGLLQSAGAYCTNDDDSLAFFLAKSGYDVWLGNNRCGFKPRHSTLDYGDPRMWAWNIRQMGVMDLPALISRVLSETGFEKLGLIAHSQGTTQTLVGLAKEQRPEISEKISVFCALAPAAYAGRLIDKAQFKFMQVISPNMFRAVFGIHSFIPFMMTMHSLLPGKLYGAMGYRVFAFLFNWTDARWERDLRDRLFQFSPVYVSAESMRWWLGRECFARQKCILATREEKTIEDREDEERERKKSSTSMQVQEGGDDEGNADEREEDRKAAERYAWYGPGTPPFALWVCGADDLVDGHRLLRRFEHGREPHVDVVHSKVIEGYEHLDVIWAMDAIEKVGKEVREVIWKTASEDARRVCRTPKGCESVTEFYKKSGTN
ncbi:Alpha/Beta hydrolase protein [Bipolaris maydis]|nr:Alpha/Beta hydrolase protein [Bipolaris maydis]KAJ5059401.1 Alpha/Beta hydrolase protein [Bipolaris maydis]KAJ6197626.1 Alpha/Beta hydrolase protein [Bipolaris maydis]